MFLNLIYAILEVIGNIGYCNVLLPSGISLRRMLSALFMVNKSEPCKFVVLILGSIELVFLSVVIKEINDRKICSSFTQV